MVVSTFKLPESNCPSCGAPARFVGIERHETEKNTNVLTFECGGCGNYAVNNADRKPFAPRRRQNRQPEKDRR